MAKYITAETLKGAIDRLAICSANSSLGDYLIFKRAAVLTASDRKPKSDAPVHVVTGTKSKPFVTAVEEFSATGGGANTPPYYLPFGAKRDKTLGFRTPKFPSNGSSDTASRWQSRESKPLAFVSGTSPKAYTVEHRSAKQLADFFLAQHGTAGSFSGEKPRLVDTAVWWLRNVEFKDEPDVGVMTQALIHDLGLTPEEMEGLFHIEPPAAPQAVAATPA
jgi:hypothetical protein